MYSDGTTSIRRANDAPIPLSPGLLLHSSVCPYVRGQHFPCLTKCLVASYLLFTYLPTVVSTLPHTFLTVIPKEHAASGPSGELHRAACHLDSFSSMTGNSSFNTRRQRPMSRMELRTASIVQAAAAPPSSPKPPRHTGCQCIFFFCACVDAFGHRSVKRILHVGNGVVILLPLYTKNNYTGQLAHARPSGSMFDILVPNTSRDKVHNEKKKIARQEWSRKIVKY